MDEAKQPLNQEPKTERTWTKESRKFGISGSMELKRLELVLENAEEDLEKDPDNEDKQDLKEIAELRIELFKADHDNAGAFKFNRLGRELRDLFDVEGEHGLKVDDEGNIKHEKGQENHRLLVVNMSELDRFNKEGGHEAGDGVLKNAAHEIESAVLDVLKGEKAYRLYRSAGNEFMVDFPDIDEETLKAVKAKVLAAKPAYPGVKEPAPLSANTVNMVEAIGMVNQVQASGDLPFRNPDEANRALVDMVKDLGGFRLEVDKFKTRTRRMRKKLDDGDQDAEAFFKNYLQREFTGTKFETLEGFRSLIEAGPQAWDNEVERVAFDRARERYEVLKEAQTERDAIIQRSLNERLKKGPVFREQVSLQDDASPIAKIPKQTFGDLAVAEKKQAYEDIPDDEQHRYKKEKAQIKMEIEERQRDRGTGLNARGKYFSTLEKSLEKPGGSVVFIDMAFLKYFDQKGGRDVGNAALKVAAEILERTLREHNLAGEAYRLGGDEFTVRLDGPEEDAIKFIEAMNQLRDEVGRIPDTERSDKTYAPTKLSFNYGICDRSLMEKVYADLEKAGLVNPDVRGDKDDLANYKAELFTVIADRSIEGEKAVSRFHLLVGEMRHESYEKDEARREQVETLVTFSQKAIFTDFKGDAELRRIAADKERYPNGSQELDEEIRRVVTEKAGDAKRAEGQFVSIRNQLIELHVHIDHLTERLWNSEEENKDLWEQLKQVKAEKDKLLGIREAIDAA